MILLDRLTSSGLHPRQVSANKGGEYACACPGCGGADKPGDPSDRFHAWPEQEGGPICQEAGVRGTFWCRKCGAGGDVLEYLMAFDGMSFAQACEALGAKASAKRSTHGRLPQPPKTNAAPVFAPASLPLPPDVWRERAASLVAKCHERLLETPIAIGWLAARGLDLDAVRKYRLGYLSEEPNRAGTSTGIFRNRSAWGLPVKETKDAEGKPSVRRSMWIPRGIVVPAYEPGAEFDPEAKPIRLRIRRRKADIEGTAQPKYYVVPGSCMAPMLLGAARRSIVVVEAELDAMLVDHLAGDKTGALSVLTNLGKPDTAAHAALGRALTVLVALDYDKAGANGWAWWRQHYATARRWPVPVGKDPGDAYAAGADLRTWIIAGLPPILREASSSTPLQVAAPAPQPVASQQPAARVGESSTGALSPQGEGQQPAPSAPPLPEWHAVILWANTTAARQRLAAWMQKHRVTYGPDSTGARTWCFPADLAPAEVDALFGELLTLVTPDLERLLLAHPARTVTARKLLETSCPRSAT